MSQFISSWKTLFFIALCVLPISGISASPCEIVADYDPRASAPVSVQFSLACHTMTPKAAVWTFGDGTVLVGNPIVHTYIANGAFEVSVDRPGRASFANRTIHVPAFDILDDFEDSVASLFIWQIPDDPEVEDDFRGRFVTNLTGGVPNVEFKTRLAGLGPDGGGHYGASGLILPPIGGGGQNPINWPPDALPAGSREGQIAFDFRYDIEWNRSIGGDGPYHATLIDIIGTQARLIVENDGNQLGLRLQGHGAESNLLTLGEGDLETRVSMKILRPYSLSIPTLRLDWHLLDGTMAATTVISLPLTAEVIGFSATDSLVEMNAGTAPSGGTYGAFYYDNFQFAHHAD